MKKLLLIFALAVFINACDDVEPTPTNDEELITTLQLDFFDGASTKTIKFQDIDGDGGNAQVITADTLSANTTYNVSITVLNESETPAESINPEIIEEGDEHQFFFIPESTLNYTSSYNDMDENNKPIGLENVVITGNASEGTLIVVLRHQPDKNGTNVNAGDITNAGGETDIEVSFDVVIE